MVQGLFSAAPSSSSSRAAGTGVRVARDGEEELSYLRTLWMGSEGAAKIYPKLGKRD